jgi:phosphoribosylaminoimidazolecarboxamide formyltransferase / IMP cyclohydrolase
MHRALLSVSNKRGIVEFASTLRQHFDILSTGGTMSVLREAEHTSNTKYKGSLLNVSDICGEFDEMLRGRVKTLHPAVHGGLLARLEHAGDVEDIDRHDIVPISLVCCNLYPFEAHNCVENIDVGGVAMLRAGAKNFERVVTVCDPDDYSWLAQALLEQRFVLTDEQRRSLAAKTFEYTARYDSAVARWMAASASGGDDADDDEPFDRLAADLAADRVQTLRYGENPHQRAAVYRWRGADEPYSVLAGKEMSYNNVIDAESAWDMVDGADVPTVSIVKHATPCGVAQHATSSVLAFDKALASDPVSAFGGILATNCSVDVALVNAIGKLFLEAIVAAHFDDDAIELLKRRKKNLRAIRRNIDGGGQPQQQQQQQQLSFRSIANGFIAQSSDSSGATVDESQWCVVTKCRPSAAQMSDLRFAWRVVKHVKSNGIVIAHDGATVGIGSGQPNRVTSVHLAARFAGDRAQGAVLASDAFFPFADGVELAAKAGITAIIQTGGSIRDQQVIDAANKHNIAMLVTSQRHFRH